MITELNYFAMTPAVWAIACATGRDVDVARSMLKNNIRSGYEVDPMDKLPDEFTPNWAELKKAYDAAPVDAGVNSDFNIFARVMNENYKELVALWKEEDYQGMVTLMENTVDPGPVGNGPARKEWEEAKKEAEEGETTEPAE